MSISCFLLLIDEPEESWPVKVCVDEDEAVKAFAIFVQEHKDVLVFSAMKHLHAAIVKVVDGKPVAFKGTSASFTESPWADEYSIDLDWHMWEELNGQGGPSWYWSFKDEKEKQRKRVERKKKKEGK